MNEKQEKVWEMIHNFRSQLSYTNKRADVLASLVEYNENFNSDENIKFNLEDIQELVKILNTYMENIVTEFNKQ